MLAALRIGEFTLARRTGSILSMNDADAEALSLAGDALWAAGFFDEADREYARALAVDPESARARYGIARSLSSRSRLTEGLSEVGHALELSPGDSDLRALQGTILERLNRFDEAAQGLRGVRRSVAEARVRRHDNRAQPSDAAPQLLETSAPRRQRRGRESSSHPAVQAREQQDRRPGPVEWCAG